MNHLRTHVPRPLPPLPRHPGSGAAPNGPALLALLALLALPVGCATGGSRAPDPIEVLAEPVRILDSGSASSDAFPEVGHFVIADATQLPAGYIPPVPVDFETQSLVIVALGPQPAGSGLAIESIQREGARLVVSGRSSGATGGSADGAETAWPYAWALIPRGDTSWVDAAID